MNQHSLKVFQVNAFTNQIFRGNPAGVVMNADGLSDIQMQDIARELNNSETAFVFKPTDSSHDYQVRFFTPTTEIPSCGHASISTGYLWAREHGLSNTVFHQKIKIGTLPLEVETKNGKQMVFMGQAKPVLRDIITGDLKERVLAALHLNESDILEALPMQAVTTGHGKVIVPLKDRAVLNRIKRNNAELSELSEIIGENGFFPFVLDSSEPGVQVHARMFAPKIGLDEDPVTGNGNGPLGAYLAKYNVLPCKTHKLELVTHQGEQMNRSGYAHIRVGIEKGEPVSVSVGGECVVVFETTIEVKSTD